MFVWVWLQDLKLKFYQLMIELDEHEGSYLEICKHYRAICDTPQIKENKDKMKEVCTGDSCDKDSGDGSDGCVGSDYNDDYYNFQTLWPSLKSHQIKLNKDKVKKVVWKWWYW